ncbi:hypothetical protein GCM10011410_02900 [Hoyosella rhizosphaerae]|uniref:Uncharacterized protein n=2 Tax=Hoyosella rhizosphaerae TaxID=1755582 RepID=A0A916TZF2_9ACTN|nr:hypothetical protein GCM10011410_02900 [Hoyosella rhizosphaerae]
MFAVTVPQGCYAVKLGDDAHNRYPVPAEPHTTLVTSATKSDVVEVMFYDGPTGLGTNWAAGTILVQDQQTGAPVSAVRVTVERCDKSSDPYTSPRSFADGRIVIALAPGCHTVQASDAVTEFFVDVESGFDDVRVIKHD